MQETAQGKLFPGERCWVQYTHATLEYRKARRGDTGLNSNATPEKKHESPQQSFRAITAAQENMRAAPGIIILQHQKTRNLNHQSMQSCSRPSANVSKRTVEESSMQYSSYRPKAATPKRKTRESNAELTLSCVQQGRESPFLLTQYPNLVTQN
jgi:hypothetical protein